MIAKEEKVLCIARAELPEAWLQDAGGIKMSACAFYDCLKGVPINWMARRTVELDPSYKQLIPYVVLQTLDGLYTGCYRRNGTEERLHALWSVGIGGHVNVGDRLEGEMDLSAIVYRGMEREVKEEFRSLPPENIQPVFHGIINEEKTAVGHVHIGLVHRIHVTDMSCFRPGEELAGFAWLDFDEILSRPLEIWSRLALNLLEEEQG
ncbi:MAG: phosphoesterase [Desulfatiglandales bacterium]